MAHNDNDILLTTEEATQLGKFFALQYYGLLCGEPDHMRGFYAEDSTMIHVVNGNDDDAIIKTNPDKIGEYISTFNVNVDKVQIKSIHSQQNCWGPSILSVVMGSVKLKESVLYRNFVQTMYLAPHWKKGEKRGYFIMNDILHTINLNFQLTHQSKPVKPLKSKDIDPRFFSESVLPSQPVTDTDNGNSDEAKMKKITELVMSDMMSRIEFLALPRKQQAPRQLGFDSSVWKTPVAQDEASSSSSASVAKADDTIQENIDAPKIEEPKIVQEEPSQDSNNSDDQSDLPTLSTSGGRGRGRGRNNSSGRGSGDRNKGKEKQNTD